MTTRLERLRALERRYDGPIPEAMLRAAMADSPEDVARKAARAKSAIERVRVQATKLALDDPEDAA